MEGGRPNDYGTMFYRNGDIYKGYFVNGLK